MQRTESVDDMVGNLWRPGRTPSQEEFERLFSNIAQMGSQHNWRWPGRRTAVAGRTGLTRRAFFHPGPHRLFPKLPRPRREPHQRYRATS
jgi:hypothetical protein